MITKPKTKLEPFYKAIISRYLPDIKTYVYVLGPKDSALFEDLEFDENNNIINENGFNNAYYSKYDKFNLNTPFYKFNDAYYLLHGMIITREIKNFKETKPFKLIIDDEPTNIDKYIYNRLHLSIKNLNVDKPIICPQLNNLSIEELIINVKPTQRVLFNNFSETTTLKTVNMSSLKMLNAIGIDMFRGCTNLKDIKLPDTINKIGMSAFELCNFEHINLPNSLKIIDGFAFARCCSLQEINIPEGVNEIKGYAFHNCTNLLTAALPQNLMFLNEGVFEYCINLKNIILDDLTRLKSIGNSAFENCQSIKSLNIPETVNEIGNAAFSNCLRLESINLPPKLEMLNYDMFNNCMQLRNINLKSLWNLKYIAHSAFFNCTSLTEINLSNSKVRVIGDNAFSCCNNLTKIILPTKLESIGNHAFDGCFKLDLDLSNLKELNYIGESAFKDCIRLKIINLKHSHIKVIRDATFERCSNIEKVLLPHYVNDIGDRAFAFCMNLEEIVNLRLDSEASEIADNAFLGCPKLKLNY